MKHTVILPVLILASCAPVVQQNPSYRATRSYAATCPQVLEQLDAVAARTQPAMLFGGNTWTPLKVTDRVGNRVTYISTVPSLNLVNPTVTVTGSCTETDGRATLTLVSTGQREGPMTALHTALLSGITLPQ